MSDFKKIYVLGAGAVGCFFGGMLARANKDVTLIARHDRAESISRDSLYMDCQKFQETIQIKATSDLEALRGADLILLAVKSPDTKKVIHKITPILPANAVILSLQNGVANVDIASSLISNAIYPAVVYVACGMVDKRTMKHHGRGELVIGGVGALNPMDVENLEGICALFQESSVPCVMSKNIKRDMWLKFIVNCVYNGLSGIGQISYGEMVKIPEVVQLINSVTREFLEIAACEGVTISLEEAQHANDEIAKTMATQISSTAQDLSKKKKTEIDFLNGYIVELSKKYKINVPSNASILAMVKMLESRFL